MRHDPPDQQGFTLIETMVACVLLLIGMTATLTVVTQAASTTLTSRTREQATSLQRELVEAARSVPYDQLTLSSIGSVVQTRPALADDSAVAAGWTVVRRNATYTVSMGVCTVDDPRDGLGDHAANVFCAGSGPPPTPSQCASLLTAAANGTLASVSAGLGVNPGQCGIDANADGIVDGLLASTSTTCAGTCPGRDSNPADYKRIVSLVRWRDGKFNLQTSQVNNPGLSAAPAVTGLTTDLGTSTAITDSRASLGLTATTTNNPVSVAFYLDGTFLGTSPTTTGNARPFSWSMGDVTGPPTATTPQPQPGASEVVDGSYELSAKAFDAYGQYGATRSQTIIVNRRRPFATAHVEGGRNLGGVEVEWSPARERDSDGFRVERRVRTLATTTTPEQISAWAQVAGCGLAARTACLDTTAPAASATDTLEYSVVGVDRDPNAAPRDGDRSEVVAINDTTPSPVPGKPVALQLQAVGGAVQLTWTAPAGAPVPDHYNVYRGGQDYDHRLDSVYVAAGQSPSYTDTRTSGVAHTYWIKAVNGQLGESVASDGVTG